MSGVNLIHLYEMTNHLAPFIIVSYFVLNSIFNWNPRGIVYLLGLIIVSGIATMISKLTEDTDIANDAPCNIITLTGDIKNPLSTVPLNMVVYTYSLAYLLTSTLLYLKSYSDTNIPTSITGTIILFCILFIIEALKTSKCFSIPQLLIAIVCGVGWGVGWGYFIFNLASPDLAFYGITSDVCVQNSAVEFVCH